MMRKLLVMVALCLIMGSVSAQHDIFKKNGAESDINVTSDLASVSYTNTVNGVSFYHTIFIDGSLMAVNYNSQSSTREIWGSGNGIGNSDILIQHDFDGSVNDKLKGTITIKTPHTITFPYTLQNGASIYSYSDGFKITTGATKYSPGIIITPPTAVNNTGGTVPVWYTYDSSKITLNINDAGQEYPITIDPSFTPDIPLGYGNVTSYTYNITSPMGSQTSYQMKFILSNSSGSSGYYAPDNIIYTNGLTRPDWYDVNATDESNTPLPFWIENNTQTAKNATAWVNVPAINVGNTSVGKWYYGNASQTESAMNRMSTFPLTLDAGVWGSINTTEWKSGGTGSESLTNANTINAAFNVTGGSSAWRFDNSVTTFGYNYSIRSRSAVTQDTAAGWGIGFTDSGVGNNQVNIVTDSTPTKAYQSVSGGSTSSQARTSTLTSYTVIESKRNPASTTFYENNVLKATITTNVPSGSLNATIQTKNTGTSTSVNWLFVRKAVLTEPITSLYSTASTGGTPPVASFSCTPTSVVLGNSITCTDASTNSPTNWTYYWGDGNVTDGTQNPSYTYPITGTFSINQTVNNTLGASWYNRSDYITITNVSGFTQQDLWQTGHYTITLNIKDSTNAPIPVVTVTDSNGQSYTTTNGTAYFTEDAGAVVFYFASNGYVSKAVSYIVDEDATHTVQLVTAGTTNNPGIVYIPQQVRFQLIGTDGAYLSNVFIQATPINFTAPANWTETLLGISPSVGIRDTTVYGTTASDGSWVAPMLQSFQYQINLTRGTDVNYNFTIYPLSNDYKFTIPVAGWLPIVTPSNIVSYSLQNATINESSTVMYQFINMTYNDGSLNTDKLSFVVYNANNTLVYSQNYTGAAANAQNFSYVQQCNKGQAYTYGFQANQSAYGWINQSSTIKLISQVELLANGPAWITQWFAIAMIVIFGTLFMIFSKAYALVGIPLLTWSFQYVFGFLPATFLSNVALGCMLTIGVLVYIRQAENKIQ